MLACGLLRDPALLPRYQALLVPKSAAGDFLPTDPVAITAAWGVARMHDARAIPLLRTLAKRGTTEMRALAMLGLADMGDKGSLPLAMELAGALDAGDVARAAAVNALGELGARSALPLLRTLALEGDPLPRQMALVALARLSDPGLPAAVTQATLATMADAVFAGGDPDSARTRVVGEALRKAGAAALTMMVTGRGETRKQTELFPVPEGPIVVETVLNSRVPQGFSPAERAAVLTAHADVIQRAAQSALSTSSDRARVVLADLAEGNGSFEPFLGPENDPVTEPARDKAKALIASLEPAILGLVHHQDVRLRLQSITLLAASESPASVAALVDALSDPEESVERVALLALGTSASHREAKALDEVARVLEKSDVWSVRVLAAQALARLGSGAHGVVSPLAATHLEQAALHDPYAMVREAALRALVEVDRARSASASPPPRGERRRATRA